MSARQPTLHATPPSSVPHSSLSLLPPRNFCSSLSMLTKPRDAAASALCIIVSPCPPPCPLPLTMLPLLSLIPRLSVFLAIRLLPIPFQASRPRCIKQNEPGLPKSQMLRSMHRLTLAAAPQGLCHSKFPQCCVVIRTTRHCNTLSYHSTTPALALNVTPLTPIQFALRTTCLGL